MIKISNNFFNFSVYLKKKDNDIINKYLDKLLQQMLKMLPFAI